MKMTKHDIADIALVWMATVLVIAFIQSFITFGLIIAISDKDMQHMDRSTIIMSQSIAIFILGFISFMLIFRRRLLLNTIFPASEEKDLSIPENLTALTSYTFWVRLIGIFIFLQSGTDFLGRLPFDIASNELFLSTNFWTLSSGTFLISTVLATLIIWQAEWLSDQLERIKSSSNAPGNDKK